jgi:hypothetical protein
VGQVERKVGRETRRYSTGRRTGAHGCQLSSPLRSTQDGADTLHLLQRLEDGLAAVRRHRRIEGTSDVCGRHRAHLELRGVARTEAVLQVLNGAQALHSAPQRKHHDVSVAADTHDTTWCDCNETTAQATPTTA